MLEEKMLLLGNDTDSLQTGHWHHKTIIRAVSHNKQENQKVKSLFDDRNSVGLNIALTDRREAPLSPE